MTQNIALLGGPLPVTFLNPQSLFWGLVPIIKAADPGHLLERWGRDLHTHGILECSGKLDLVNLSKKNEENRKRKARFLRIHWAGSWRKTVIFFQGN